MTSDPAPKLSSSSSWLPPRKLPRRPRSSSPKEHSEAAAFISWCHRASWRGVVLADLMIMIPNGAYLGASLKGRQVTMARLRREGFRSGITDYMLPVPALDVTEGPRYAGLWLELKRTDAVPSDVRKEQRAFMSDMVALGYQAVWAAGADEAQRKVQDYLARTLHPVMVGYSPDTAGQFSKDFYARRVTDYGPSKL